MSEPQLPRPRLKEPAVGAAFERWWKDITQEAPSGPQRADRATLRRAHDLTTVVCTPAYQRVYNRLLAARSGRHWLPFEQERLAAAVALAAHVKGESRGLRLPRAMSKDVRAEGVPADPSDDRNPVSELRFRRLLESPDIDALFTGLRRVLPMIDGRVDPLWLFQDVLSWGHHVKKQWAYEYAWP